MDSNTSIKDFDLTELTPNLNNLEYAYINKFGKIFFTTKSILVAGYYKKVFPFTIILPEYVEKIKEFINKNENIDYPNNLIPEEV